MKNFFKEMKKLSIKYDSVENLDGYEGLLKKEEVKRLKEEIKKEVVRVIELQFYKFR